MGMGQGILHAHLAHIAPTYPGYASLVRECDPRGLATGLVLT